MTIKALRSLGSVTPKGRYLGRNAVNVIKQLSSETGLIIEQHVLRALEKQGFDLDVVRDNKSVYKPQELWPILSDYGNNSTLKFDSYLWEQAYSLTLAAFGGSGSLEVLQDKSQYLESIKMEKASGAPLFCKKADAFERDFLRMQKFARGDVAAQPCVAYHRIQHGKTGPKTRLVWGFPLHMTLLEAKYARPLIQYFLSQRSPMAFGLHRHELASRLIQIDNVGVRYAFDFSGFDRSIHPRLIDMAFNVLKTHFKTVDVLEWDRMVHYFIHTPILMPDGNVYVKHQGVPSGSYWTQMVDSIVNYFAVQYCALKLLNKPFKSGYVFVLGDDGLCGCDVFVPLAKWVSCFRDLGLRVNDLKSEVTRRGESYSFLGHTWTKGLVNRELIEIAKRMAFPERHVNIEDARLRIATRVLAYGGDALNAHLIVQRWSFYKGPNITSIYFRDVLSDPLIGWREFVNGDRSTSAYPKGALDQCYISILT